MSLEDQLNQGPVEEPVSQQEQANASVQEEQPVAPVAAPQEPEFDEPEPLPQKSERELLETRANQLGIRFRSNIGTDKLREKVNAAIAGTPAPSDDEEEESEEDDDLDDEQEESSVTSTIPSPSALAAAIPEETAGMRRKRLRNEARKLIRVRVTCHNPAKIDHEGEIFTFGNAVVGTIRRMVPFEVDWHVENALLIQIKDRKYTHHYEVTDRSTGQKVKQTKMMSEFAVEILPPLTQSELNALAQRQAMAAGTQE